MVLAPMKRTGPFLLLRALLVLGLGLVAVPRGADARIYPVDIDVVDSDDLRALYYEGVIDELELDVLLNLIENPVDLNRADQEDVFQLPGLDDTLSAAIVDERVINGPYNALGDLVARVEGMDWRLLEQIRPFAVVYPVAGSAPNLRAELGFITFKQFRAHETIENDYAARSHSAGQLGYDKWPNFGLGVHAKVQDWLTIGLVGTAQEGLWNATYDPETRDVVGAYGTPVFRPYTVFGRVRKTVGQVKLDALAGSYHLIFGEGLVMNTLGGRKRNGFNISERLSIERSDRRFREWDGLFGGAGRIVAPLGGGAELDVTLFGSIRNYDQYVGFLKVSAGEVYDPAVDNELPSPRVYVDGQRIAYQTLPNLFRVGLVGGNGTFRFNRRTHIGITGYAGLIDRTVMNGVEDPNEILLKRRWPVKRNFGSVGVNGRVGIGLIEFSGEYALWVGDDVGQALTFFFEVEPAWGSFILSARHYDLKFAGPFARGQSSSRLIAGLRTRGQQGVQFTALIDPIKRLQARVTFDLNHLLDLDVYDFETRANIRGRPLEFLQLELITTYNNQNLAVNGRQHEYSGTITVDDVIAYDLDEDEVEAGLNRAGERLSLAGGVRLDDRKVGSVNVRYTRTWTDAGKTYRVGSTSACDDDFLQGHSVRVWGNVKPTKTTNISGSFKYQNTDVAGNDAGTSGSRDSGPHGFESYVAVNQKIRDRVFLRIRGGLAKRLPNAPSPCDFGDNYVYLEPVVYEPTSYNLRWTGDFFVQLRVKFY